MADVLIHMHARIDQRIESDAIDREYARCDVSDCRPFVYDAGTLLLDFIDTAYESTRLARMGRRQF